MSDPFLRELGAVDLPVCLRALHSPTAAPRRWSGPCRVERGSGIVAGLLLWLGRFPAAGTVDLHLTTRREGAMVHWLRDFGGRCTPSILSFRAGRVVERFGPFVLMMRPEPIPGGFRLHVTGGRVLGLPVPRFCLPRAEVAETGTETGVAFDVAACLPWGGLLIRYRGTLTPEAP